MIDQINSDTFKDIFNQTGALLERRFQQPGEALSVIEYYDPRTQKLKQRACFLNDILEGPTLIYNKKEEVIRKFTYEKGQLQGPCEFYRDNNVYAIIPFVEGKVQGKAVYYDQGGNKRMEGFLKDGVLEGKLIFFNPFGFCLKTVPYIKGKKQGIARSYYPSGKLLKTEPYHDNLLDGNVTQYYENGDVCVWHLYKKGKLMEGPRFFNSQNKEIFRS